MEKIHFYLFLLLCVGVDGLSSDILQRQKRNWIIDSFRIDEGYTGPFPYSLGTIKVEKSLTLFEIHGQGVDEDPKGILQINNRTGEITVHGPVDYEQYNKIKLVFLALDRDSHIIDTRLGIDISVLDANDHPPIFDHPVYEVTIKESTMQGTALITIRATDDDTGDNKQFDLQIVSSSYESEELEFYITHRAGAQTGTISFKGCLDHEKAEKHIIVIEAKDHGKNRQLSSTCSVIVNIEDGNNHTPVMIGRTGPGKVKEGDTGFLVSRLQAKDDDHHGTAAWRINYAIHGDKNKIYNITTDPVTNEGLLYVTKPLDYEEFPKWNLTITLENEVAYYSCKVESKSSSGPWKVTTITAASAASAFSGAASVGISFEAASTGGSAIGGSTASGGTGGAASSTGWSMRGQTMGFSSYNVIVDVEDVNEAPVFDEPNKVAPLFENTASGQYLVTFTASDPDILTPTTFTYTKGNDPDGWIEVDSKTGKVTTTKMIDRESSFVKQNTYTVLIFASDNGTPAMTSTATLTILVKDENDNVPFINKTVIEMCQSDGPSLYTIEPVDLDDDPYSGPFSFRLSGDVDDRWSIDPLQGYSVDLVKENTVLSGYHELVLEASDAQGNMAVYTLSVTVCSCLNKEKPDCHSRQTITSKAGEGAILIVILSILLLAVMLLLTALVTCKRHFKPVRETIDAQQTLKPSNIEEPGTDCKVCLFS
ncbi:hypothetical protein INR49_013432 [Caranx melampygus]|nr:hypothetical protein INR49_013432 [Caranx melampygus]